MEEKSSEEARGKWPSSTKLCGKYRYCLCITCYSQPFLSAVDPDLINFLVIKVPRTTGILAKLEVHSWLFLQCTYTTIVERKMCQR